ncbi:M1 family metallopeptidase [Hymenobacter sp. BT770]|uniref:M1 family metallopeptidase n=1 Tax=Hymenobacter sp. BT770 TaxID=2886942 RepID=UPI001D10B8C2|nr:M1 family metallopeptidase [Hymenobacter sp. BT770]MCC3152234.1 M1 family metallopeptidase [Hymenobacter sp. BT770]MDO3414048.1 M1 family metallopeptidase [Hymenobacter sp. BT770]
MQNRILFGLLALLPGLALAQPAKPAKTPRISSAPYFQQEVNYSIDVTLDDKTHQLTGREELTYINNSPATLSFIWFHLWPNAYRDNSTAFAKQQLRNGKRKFQFAKAADRGFIDGLDFKVNGQPAKLELDPKNPDMAKLVLPQRLAAGASATISTPFRVKIPASFSRFGHVGQSYQITQWYPKPAVYDRRGWHPMPYLDQGEFYSEYGSFDVTITLPTNYTVGATGELQNPDERARMDALAAEAALKKTAKDFGKDLSFPASDAATKTLRYKQDRVHDFAWFADKRFNVLKGSVTLPSGRAVTSWVLFTNKEAQKWIKGLQDVNDALTYYSQWVGEYPYSAATAVDGALSAGSGMEYPMVTVTEPDAIVHEVGHNWFYGILGSNERDFPWMDEGVNSYEQLRVEARENPQNGLLQGIYKNKRAASALGVEGLPGSALNQVPYQVMASRGLDQPVQGPTSAAFGQNNYGIIVYFKTAALLKYLAGYLGQEKFDAAMHAYYAKWQFKHPYPEDMEAVFEESTGQKLDWFFREMLTNTREYNADIFATQQIGDVVKVLVRTDSPVLWAVPVSTVDAQGKVLQTLWTPPFGNPEDDAEAQLDFRRENVVAVVVDAEYITPELNRRDDRLLLGDGNFRRWEPVRLQPLVGVERWDRSFINWAPVLGANTSDKFMLGAAFYNNPLQIKKVQYLAMPMYSFNRNELNGIASIKLNVLPARGSRQVITGFMVQRFERYVKLEPSITVVLPHSAYDQPQHQVKIALTSVDDQDRGVNNITTVEYGVHAGNALQSWAAQVELNQLDNTSKGAEFSGTALLLRAEASYERYYSPEKRVSVRLFGGRFLNQTRDDVFFLGLSGSPDYRRQTAFLDRQQISHTVTAQLHQTDNRDGAFKAYVPATSGKWLSTLNLKADLPVTRLAVFGDFGATAERQVVEGRPAQRLFYDAGVVVPVIRNVFELYLPVAGSQYQNGLPNSRQDFTDRIRFVLNLSEANPFRLLDQKLAQ